MSNRTYEINGKQFPSVTTILSATESNEDKERLRKWQHKIDKVMGIGGAEIKRKEAARRGTLIHERIEAEWKNLHWFPGEEWEGVEKYWEQAKTWVNSYKSLIKDWEMKVWSESLGYAGTLDAVMEEDGSLVLVDFKTSRREKLKSWCKNYFLQCTAYAIAYQERTGNRISEIKTVIISPTKLQVFSENHWHRYEDEWLTRLGAFKTGVAP